METKTNAMRILTQKKIEYLVHHYPSEITVGEEVAKILNKGKLPNKQQKLLTNRYLTLKLLE